MSGTGPLAKDGSTAAELYGIIGRIIAFVDFGWSKRLKPIEKDLYLYLARRAGRGQIVQCSANELADYLGHEVEPSMNAKSYRAIRVALSSLDDHKLINIGTEQWVGLRSYRVFVPVQTDHVSGPLRSTRVDQIDPPSGSNRSTESGSNQSTEWINPIHRVDQTDPPLLIEEICNRKNTGKTPVPLEPAAAAKPKKREPATNETSFPPGVWKLACDLWVKMYTAAHEVKPTMATREWKSLKKILTAVGSDLSQLELVFRVSFQEPAKGIWQGHRINVIADNLDHVRSKAAKANQAAPSTVRRVRRPTEIFGEV